MNTENNKSETNRLIAEFIELDKANADIPLYIIGHSAYPINKLKFHSDWNWLMEVVEKIESLDKHYYSSRIEGNKMCFYWGIKTIVVVEGKSTKIESVYNACIEFIKWYNNQNK